MPNAGPHAGSPEPWRVCVLTTSFPRWEGDLNGRFVLDELRTMPPRLRFVVVAPSDAQSRDGEQPFPDIVVRRFRYFFPKRWQRLTGGNGIPDNLRRSRLS